MSNTSKFLHGQKVLVKASTLFYSDDHKSMIGRVSKIGTQDGDHYAVQHPTQTNQYLWFNESDLEAIDEPSAVNNNNSTAVDGKNNGTKTPTKPTDTLLMAVRINEDITAQPTPEPQKLDLGKIKEGDTVWVEGVVETIYGGGHIIVDFGYVGGGHIDQEDIKAHFPAEPVKTELELSEEHLQHTIESAFFLELEDKQQVKDYLDRYYIARSRVEELKNK